MKEPKPADGWLRSWRESLLYDRMEVFGSFDRRGYAYAYGVRRQHTIDLVEQSTPVGSAVLDIAAAQGNFSLTLSEMGYRVTWNDLRADLIDYVRLKWERGTLEYAPGNVFELNFPQPFDAILITEIIEHVAHPDEFLRKVAKLVRPGGHIIMTTPNGGYYLNSLPRFSTCADPSVYEAVQFKPNSDGHIFLLHEDEIGDLAAKAGLDVQSIQLFSNSLTCGHMRTELLLRVFPRKLVTGIERCTSTLPRPIRRKLSAGMAVLFRRPQR